MVAEADRVDRLATDDAADVAREIFVGQPPGPADVDHLDTRAVAARLRAHAAGTDTVRRRGEVPLVRGQVGRTRGGRRGAGHVGRGSQQVGVDRGRRLDEGTGHGRDLGEPGRHGLVIAVHGGVVEDG